MAQRMTQSDLCCIVVAHTNCRQSIERGELVLPELRLVSGRTAVGTKEVDVCQCCGGAQIAAVRGPLVAINRLGRTFAREVDVCHEGKEMFKVGNRSDCCVRIASIPINLRRELGTRGEVVASALRVDEIDRFGEVEALQQVTAEPAYVCGLDGKATWQFPLHR